jgi:phosphatidylglycerophosphate synthase
VFDAALRPLIDPPLAAAGRRLAAAGVGADALTVGGFGAGLAACVALALQAYGVALVLIAVNRLADGLDGAVARVRGPTDFGGYLDIVLDFLFYAGAPVAFAVGRPEAALPAALLVLSFVGTGSSFLAYAAIAAKRGITTARRGRKSLYYLGGLTEGGETLLFLALMCLLPDAFAWIAGIFAAACALTTATRILGALRDFG